MIFELSSPRFFSADFLSRKDGLTCLTESLECVKKKKTIRISPSIMQIFIKTLTGRKQQYNFEGDSTVLSVKQALQEKEGIQVDQIRLIYSGKQLQDEKTLQDFNVTAGGTIHMVLQLRGGRN